MCQGKGFRRQRVPVGSELGFPGAAGTCLRFTTTTTLVLVLVVVLLLLPLLPRYSSYVLLPITVEPE